MAENPNMVSKMVIGQSFQGRPLNVLKVNKRNKDWQTETSVSK